jgi:hypothetical protein
VRSTYNGHIARGAHPPAGAFTYEVAQTFWRRFFGLRRAITSDAIFFPNCACLYGFGLPKEIQVVFVSSKLQVLSVRNNFGGHEIAAQPGAAGALEFIRPQFISPGDYLRLDYLPTRSRPKGFSLVELLLALPIVLFVLFALIQIGLLWHAKFALQHAVVVAARHASVSHGSDRAIRDGLVQGLLPFFGRSTSLSSVPEALLRSGTQVTEGLALGWLRWEVLSPTRQSFQDWGQPAVRYLSPTAVAGESEIPSAPLPALALRTLPASGVERYVGGLPVGVASGQTLIDANTLTLKLQFGVPLNMPVAGPLLARALSLWSGCGWLVTSQQTKLGSVNYGYGAEASLLGSSIQCRSLAARDLQGRWKPRWPVQVFSSIVMQSSARRSQMLLRDRDDSGPSISRRD